VESRQSPGSRQYALGVVWSSRSTEAAYRDCRAKVEALRYSRQACCDVPARRAGTARETKSQSLHFLLFLLQRSVHR